jgi:transaldolase
LWASPREVLNVVQAEQCGCHIITATPDIVAKVALLGKYLNQYSLEAVKMFRDDARAAGFKLI